MDSTSLTRFAWLSIACAIVTIALKTVAYLLTGSVGLLSDALESVVNLVGAIIALVALAIAHQSPDESHLFGHTKAEYFASIIEGMLILGAAIGIGVAAASRFAHPQTIERVDVGLFIAAFASAINLVVAWQLLKAGKQYDSIALEADARHLFTDVWTSAGVIVGVGMVAVTGVTMLDPIVALLVSLNIVYTGFKIIKRSALGFMDTAIAKEEGQKVHDILDHYATRGLQYHGLRTRQAGQRRFVSLHILMPGDWSIQKGHNFAEQVERDIRQSLSHVTVFTHIEPISDKKSYEDISLDRKT